MSVETEMMIAGAAIALGGVVVGAFCAWLGWKLNQPRMWTIKNGGTRWGGFK